MPTRPYNPRWSESCDWLPCLSVHQPWAHYIVAGHKPWENRTWQTSHRGPLLIHASKTRDDVDYGLIDMISNDATSIDLVFGAIIGIVDLAHVFPAQQAIEHNLPGAEWIDPPPEDDPNFRGFAWQLRHARAFARPIPFTGQRGIMRVPRKLVAAQMEAISHQQSAISHEE